MKSRSALIFLFSVTWASVSLMSSIEEANGSCLLSLASAGSGTGSAISSTDCQEPLFLDLCHHMEQVPELSVPGFVEPFQDLCPFFYFKVNLSFPAVRDAQHRGNLVFEQERTAFPGPNECVRYRLPGEHLHEREPLCLCIVADQLVAADHTADELAVGAFYCTLDDNKVEVVYIGLGNIDRIPAETLDQFFNGSRVECAHYRVTCLHGTEGDRSFNPSDLAHKDLVGALTKCRFQEIKHRYFAGGPSAFSFALRKRNFADPIAVRNVQFGRILDSDDLVLRWDECRDCIQECCLPACGLTGNEERHPVLNTDPEIRSSQVVDTITLDNIEDA